MIDSFIFISVDCGCSNMRARLIEKGKCLVSSRRSTGGRSTASTGNNLVLKQALKECLAETVEKSGLAEKDIPIVMLSGTITSNVGVYHVHHIPAPCGPSESARGAETVLLPEISGIPMLFIPGVRTMPTGKEIGRIEEIDAYDSMSGEECEIYGLAELLGLTGAFTVTLPGSYNKACRVDADGRIISISTGMCGEFMTSIAENSLLKITLPHPVIKTLIPDKLREGYDYAEARGVSTALAKSRILCCNSGYSLDEAGSFFAGASLHSDIGAAMREYRRGSPLVIGGIGAFRSAFGILLPHAGADPADIIDAGDAFCESASPAGQLKVYREYIRLREG